MNYIIRNKNIEVKIDHPLQNYKASRFDWTGKITDVKYREFPMTITEKPDGENENIYGKGLYNEFGMDTALGFEEAEIGEWFHKIGIGLLKKIGPQYEFFKEHEIKPAEFTVEEETDRVIIECNAEEINGYAYVLRKEFVLGENQLTIKYTLKNSGAHDIATDEYVHNFMAIDCTLVDQQYKLRFPFQIHRDQNGQTVNPDGILDFQEKETRFNGSTSNQFFASYLNGTTEVEAQWQLIHQQHKVGVKESTSFPTTKVNLWGWKHVISPELFHQILIKPGESEKWSRTYHFFDLD